MKKTTATILSFFVLSAATVLPAAGLRAEKRAHAATSTVCAAATEGYAAISSDSTLYVYNRDNGGVWQEYVHSEGIAQMTFGEGDALYFRDERKNLYKLRADELEEGSAAEDTQIDCTNVFFGNGTLCHADYLNPDTSIFTDVETRFSGFYRAFAFDDEVLYALNDTYTLCRLNLSTKQTEVVADFPDGSANLTIVGATAYATANGGLFCYDLTNDESVTHAGSYVALYAIGNQIHALQNGDIYAYTKGDASPTKIEKSALPPLMQDIPTDGLKAGIESGQAAHSIVTVVENSLLMEIDLDQTSAYKRNFRTPQITALKIGQTGSFDLLAYRKSVNEEYKTYLVAHNRTTETENERALPQGQAGYITNEVKLYPYPHLGYASAEALPRGEKVTLLSEVTGLDCAYYKVSFGERTGYIPKAYVSLEAGVLPAPESTILGDEEKNGDGIWRLVYILLGAGAICILVDYLILRKPSED